MLSNEVNELLFEFIGAATLDFCTEEDLLGHIINHVQRSRATHQTELRRRNGSPTTHHWTKELQPPVKDPV